MRVQPACLIDIFAGSIDTDDAIQQGLTGGRRHHGHHAIVDLRSRKGT